MLTTIFIHYPYEISEYFYTDSKIPNNGFQCNSKIEIFFCVDRKQRDIRKNENLQNNLPHIFMPELNAKFLLDKGRSHGLIKVNSKHRTWVFIMKY